MTGKTISQTTTFLANFGQKVKTPVLIGTNAVGQQSWLSQASDFMAAEQPHPLVDV